MSIAIGGFTRRFTQYTHEVPVLIKCSSVQSTRSAYSQSCLTSPRNMLSWHRKPQRSSIRAWIHRLTSASRLHLVLNIQKMPWRRNLVVGKLSARKARSPLATARDQLSDPSAAHELLAIEAVGYKVANLDHTAVILQRYNNIIHFASRSQRRLQDVQDRHEQIAITRDKILETWHEALKAIRQLEEQLEGEVALQQELIVLEDNPWYRRGDILG